MSVIFLKDGVKLKGVEGQSLHGIWDDALPVIEKVFRIYESKTVITSAWDGKHSVRSLHYEGQALDS